MDQRKSCDSLTWKDSPTESLNPQSIIPEPLILEPIIPEPLMGLNLGLGIPTKNNSAEDGIDGTNGYFRRNSGCSTEQKFSEFRSEPFRRGEIISEFRSAEQK